MSQSHQEAIAELHGALARSPRQPAGEVTYLEPATLPSFGVALRGYQRGEVDEFVDYQRQRLAAMRRRALRAEHDLDAMRRGRPRSAGEGASDETPAAASALSVSASGECKPLTVTLGLHGRDEGRKRHLSVIQRERRERLRRFGRYGAVSILSIALTEVLLAISYGVFHLASATTCSLVASAVAAIPAYLLYRRFVWRLRSRSRLKSEVLPFWVTTAVGVVLSTLAVGAAVHFVSHHPTLQSHTRRAVIVDGASLASFGLLWLARYGVFNRWVFGGHGGSDATSAVVGVATEGT